MPILESPIVGGITIVFGPGANDEEPLINYWEQPICTETRIDFGGSCMTKLGWWKAMFPVGFPQKNVSHGRFQAFRELRSTWHTGVGKWNVKEKEQHGTTVCFPMFMADSHFPKFLKNSFSRCFPHVSTDDDPMIQMNDIYRCTMMHDDAQWCTHTHCTHVTHSTYKQT